MDAVRILAKGGRVAERLPGYEVRPQQLEMAGAVAEAFKAKEHLLVEAGTGVGKSFAYLIPAIQRVTEEGGRVAVSTHTIALQEQLISKDIPFLRSIFKKKFSAVLVKGRSNYLGIRRLTRASRRQDLLFDSEREVAELHAIQDWAYETKDGSLSDLDRRPSPAVWDRVKSESDDCLGRRCEHFARCFYQRARRRAGEAQILVVNHAMLFSDLALRRRKVSLLPAYDALVLDEAHTVESVAGDHLGLSIGDTQVRYLLNSLHNEGTGRGTLWSESSRSAVEAVGDANRAADEYFGELEAWHGEQPGWNGRLREPPPFGQRLSGALVELREELLAARKKLDGEEARLELSAAAERCTDFVSEIDDWHQQTSEGWVYWLDVARSRRRRVTLSGRPIDVGPVLKEYLFDRIASVVLTSATLTTGGANPFSYIKERLSLNRDAGLSPGEIAQGWVPTPSPDEREQTPGESEQDPSDRSGTDVRTLALGSPFNYREQVTVYVEADMPEPSDAGAFTLAACEAIKKYLLMSDGRAFVLFTSYDMLARCARDLSEFLDERNMPLLEQGSGMPRSRLLERFREVPRSVLFGTSTFWAGVDVPGESLSNVIIVKLPFAVPNHPIVEARIEHIRAGGGNPFMSFQVPEAVLKFKQGVGRLIRRRDDRGIIVILDPRVLNKPYGRRFLDALPDCRIIIEKVRPKGRQPGRD